MNLGITSLRAKMESRLITRVVISVKLYGDIWGRGNISWGKEGRYSALFRMHSMRLRGIRQMRTRGDSTREQRRRRG